MTDGLEAARDARPRRAGRGGTAPGYDAAMRVARWLLVPMVVLVAGCLSNPAAELPASFLREFSDRGQTFTAAPVSRADENQDAMVRAARDRYTALVGPVGRALPVFGVMTCIAGHPACGRLERYVWLVIFPDATSSAGDVAWVLLGDDDDLKTTHEPSE